MTDIVERLRKPVWEMDRPFVDERKEAADEIERLHSLTAELVAALEEIATFSNKHVLSNIARAALARAREEK